MNLKSVWAILFASVLASGCAQIKIRDAEWCGDMGELGASCFYTLSDRQRDVDKESWDAERMGQVCTKAENFADLKKTLLKLCRKNPRCEVEVNQKFDDFVARMERFKSIYYGEESLPE